MSDNWIEESIDTLSYIHSKTHVEIIQCLQTTSLMTNSTLEEVVNVVKRDPPKEKHFYIHYYDEDKDEQYDDIELSTDVMTCLSRKGYTLIRKMGQGSSADAFLAKSREYGYVVILIKGNAIKRDEHIYKIYADQQTGVLDTKYMIKIYDVIECPRLTLDKRYHPHVELNPIQVLEYAPMNLEDYIKLSRKTGVGEKLIKEKIVTFLTEAYNYIETLGYTYTDLKIENLVVLSGRIKFIDLETLRKNFLENPKDISQSVDFLLSDI